jgi:hypothetical protein
MSYYNLGLLYFDAEFGGLDKIARMDKAAELFNAFLAKSPTGPAVERATKFAKDASQLSKTERELKAQADEKKRRASEGPPAEERETPAEESPSDESETPIEETPAAEETAP